MTSVYKDVIERLSREANDVLLFRIALGQQLFTQGGEIVGIAEQFDSIEQFRAISFEIMNDASQTSTKDIAIHDAKLERLETTERRIEIEKIEVSAARIIHR